MRSSAAAVGRTTLICSGMPQKWGLSFDINTQPGPNGRGAGSISWAGLLNCYDWIDPVKRVTGIVHTQLLPFDDLPS
jgi:hypothetical protein